MYADRNDMVLRFGEREVKQLEASIQAENSMSVDATLQDASEEVDGYIAVRYSLPLTETPQNLKRLVCDIARYKLWKSRASDEVRQRYEDAIAFLKLIANNKASLLIKNAFTLPPRYSSFSSIISEPSLINFSIFSFIKHLL